MSVELVYPSSKLGSVTRTKNKITRFIEENPNAPTDELEPLREELLDKIKIFDDACTQESEKDVPEEDIEEFEKWQKKNEISNKLFLNKLEKLILKSSSDYEDSETESSEDEEDVTKKLIKCFKSMQASSHLPQHEPLVFDGSDITEYNQFVLSFQQSIEKRCDNYQDKYFYLLKYTNGEAKTLVKSCHSEDSKKAFVAAKALLKEKYGNEYLIAQNYIDKLQQWPQIKTEDSAQINKFATFLSAIDNIMNKMSTLNQLNSPRDIKEIVMKLPYNMRVQFRNKSAELMEKNKDITFNTLVKFVNQQAAQLNVPLFGDISDRKPANKGEQRDKSTRDGCKSSRTFFTNERESKEKFCPCCRKSNHYLQDCFFFTKRSEKEKEDFIRKNNLCYSCLRNSNHISKNCTNKLTCRHCGKSHPSCLHRNTSKSEKKTEELTDKKDDSSKDNTRDINLVVKAGSKIACPAIPVIIQAKKTKKLIKTYAALDNYSTASYMNIELMHDLGIKGHSETLEITTIDDNKIKINTSATSELEILSLDKSTCLPLTKVYAKEKWPFQKEDSPSRENIKEKEFSDIPFQFIESNIGILIGMNEPDILKPLQIVQSTKNGPYASRHKLGWALNGPINGSSTSNNCFRTKINNIEELENKFDKVFSSDYVEEKGSNAKNFTLDEQQWLQFVRDHHVQNNDTHHEINLPINNEINLPNNYMQIYGRLQALTKRLLSDENLKKEYIEFMSMMQEKGYMEKVPNSETHPQHQRAWFLAHHAVRHKKKGKLRIVFDCSLQYKGISLNDVLKTGPDLTNSLVGVLLRFRQHSIAVSGDIEKMFYSVKVPKEDRTYLRFLWYPQNDLAQQPIQYWLTVHLFGATSSPSIANYVLRDCVHEKEPIVKETVQNSFYVDDMLASFIDDETAINVLHRVKSSLKEASFNLTSFASNSPEVLKTVFPQELNKSVPTLNIIDDESIATQALGMKWHTTDDMIGFDVRLPEQPNTRRGVLSTIHSVYDPLFLATPAVIKAKRIFQITCAEKLAWDSPLPAHLLTPWQLWKKEVLNLRNFKIPRCFHTSGDLSNIKSAEMHIFSDGSEIAYGAVAYLSYKDDLNKVETSIVMSKSRLTPLNRAALKTVPRIELNAAKLAVLLYEKLIEEIRDIAIERVTFWTDSMSTLQYIINENNTFHRFVTNRVAYIRSQTDVNSWRYVPGQQNPADQLSRGVTKVSSFVECDLWKRGPEFLAKSDNEWPKTKINTEISSDDPEIKNKKISLATKSTETNSLQLLIESTSNLHKLLCRIATFLRLKEYLKTKVMKHGKMSATELDNAKTALWTYSQRECFSDTINLIKRGKELPKKNKLKGLMPFIDSDGLLRVGGRLTQANLTYSAKHPIILHAESRPAKMVIADIHRNSGHLGRETILTESKQMFHLIKGNKVIRDTIKKCVICRKVCGKPASQIMADLPEDRVSTDSPPFTNTATDLFGPFYVAKGKGRTQEKRYGVIFTCLVSRATHIEITPGLDTDSFINAFRRFIARRGTPRIIRSDNGTNLTSADKELKESINEWNKSQIHDYLLQKNIDWKFQPPYSSHFGGVFERQIRTIRKIFASLLCDFQNKTKLTDDIILTLFAEIENIMNNIPLTTVTSDVNDDIPITPNTLLKMQQTCELPPGLFTDRDVYSTKVWRRIQYLADQFWVRYRKEYLPLLYKRQKWDKTKRPIAVNDIVLISDQCVARNNYCLGKVLAVNKSHDGVVRSAEILVNQDKGKQKITRPIHKLILINECSESSDSVKEY